MAIKGKGKTRQRQPSRAPRRAPVPVKPPLFQRGWMKALLAFLAGILVLALAWWAWENLNQEHADSDRTAQQALQREAIQAWGKSNLEATLATVGQLQGGGTPQIATNVGTAIDALQKGTDPGATADDMTTLAAKLDTAAGKLEKFNLSETISDHGFDSSQTDVITTLQVEISSALRDYAVSARITARAIDDPADKQIAGLAKDSYDTAQTLLQRGWNSYTNIAAVAGVPLQSQQTLPTGG
jgi:hypothetical protein